MTMIKKEVRSQKFWGIFLISLFVFVDAGSVRKQKDHQTSDNQVEPAKDLIDLDVDSHFLAANISASRDKNEGVILDVLPDGDSLLLEDDTSDDADDIEDLWMSGSGDNDRINKADIKPQYTEVSSKSTVATEETTTIKTNVENSTTKNISEEPKNKSRFLRLCEIKNCQYGGVCVRSSDNSVACACEKSCDNVIPNRVCGSDGVFYPSICHLKKHACEKQTNVTIVNISNCLHDELPCDESQSPSWSSWSIWLQSGSNDFRFRFCKINGAVTENLANCGNDRIEVKPCKRREINSCTTTFGEENTNFEYACTGTDVQDITSLDQVFEGKLKNEITCKFSLFDVELNTFVHSNWTKTDLEKRGDHVLWCKHRTLFVPYSTANKHCQEELNNFCFGDQDTTNFKCKSVRRVKKFKGHKRSECWKKMLLNQKLPEGIPNITDKYYVCQRFAAKTNLAKVYGDKKTQFGTIYDPESRIPLISFGFFDSLGSEMWPVVPYMAEKGLLPTDFSLTNLIYDEKKKGIVEKEVSNKEQLCQNGANQAFPVDFDNSNYHMMQLLTPEIIGEATSKRIATFAMTNVAPIHITIATAWKQAIQNVRRFAIEHCRVPLSTSNESKRRRSKYNRPEVYTVSGVVPSTQPEVLLNNRVNVPKLFWIGTCCLLGGEAHSFAMYARNAPDGHVMVTPVAQLEILLQDRYIGTEPIRLFPAFDKICSDVKHDVSQSYGV